MTIRESLSQSHPDMEFCDHIDGALIGVAQVWTVGGLTQVALYDREKAIDILSSVLNLSAADARDVISDRSMWAFMGKRTPAFASIVKGV